MLVLLEIICKHEVILLLFFSPMIILILYCENCFNCFLYSTEVHRSRVLGNIKSNWFIFGDCQQWLAVISNLSLHCRRPSTDMQQRECFPAASCGGG